MAVICIPAACVQLHIQIHVAWRGVCWSLGYPGPLKGPAAVALLDAVSISDMSPSPSQLGRAEMGDVTRAPEVSQ